MWKEVVEIDLATTFLGQRMRDKNVMLAADISWEANIYGGEGGFEFYLKAR